MKNPVLLTDRSVAVTQGCMNSGLPGSPYYCPVALAVALALPKTKAERNKNIIVNFPPFEFTRDPKGKLSPLALFRLKLHFWHHPGKVDYRKSYTEYYTARLPLSASLFAWKFDHFLPVYPVSFDLHFVKHTNLRAT